MLHVVAHDLVQGLRWIDQNRGLVAAYVTGGGGLAIALETFLQKLKNGFTVPIIKKFVKLDSKKFAFSALHAISALTSLSAWYLGLPAHEAVGAYATLAIVAQGWHRFVVSGMFENYVMPFLTWLSQQKAPTSTIGAATTVSTPTGTTTTSVSGSAPVAATAVIGGAGDAKPFNLQ